MIRRLRERGQPIRLFGENDVDSAKRLKYLESQETEKNGMRNDFKVAMDKSEQESLNEIMNSLDSSDNNEENTKVECEHTDDETFLKEIAVIKHKK